MVDCGGTRQGAGECVPALPFYRRVTVTKAFCFFEPLILHLEMGTSSYLDMVSVTVSR